MSVYTHHYCNFEGDFESWFVHCDALGLGDIVDGLDLVEGMRRELGW